ncbi:MAG: hypothetical protein WDA06_05585 [Phenylobacterium sp.]
MRKSWYQQILPTVDFYKQNLNRWASILKENNNINSVFVWGEYVTNLNNKKHILKYVDMLVTSNFHSEDLSSIINNELSPLNIKLSVLENLGYNTDTILFTNEFIKLGKNIKKWVLSKDNKILFWGPELNFSNNELMLEAIKYAENITNIKYAELQTQDKNHIKHWEDIYDCLLCINSKDTPQSWHITNIKKNNIINKGILIL